ncbi:LacI family transcriptional regulator [Thalassobacillus devorans]|uniref:LacI family transcriptional regulator n=1 Tax=Thalassobacillus devorans TaxID=279813 RepID=A0ABQ1NTY0_9BACI|nr:LacI family DNA-binding transcriptional regulator [Thalassobacillus devorans]NIK28673.1 DNA-binding LacI/PurR family transcriptional regulator [Thalassobacillus devorans]GGC84422.1 LacI family transcriptional regulator [Thalassobacillus devorans]
MKPTIYDIANKANVSKSTVSRFLNNNPNISTKKRNQIQKAIEELNYQPSKIARGLSSGFDAILVISRSTDTTKNNPFFSEILHVISRYSEEEDYDVILQTSQDDVEEIKRCIAKTASKIVKGIIMLSSPSDSHYFREIDNLNIPTVVIGKVDGDYSNIYSVDTNNFSDSYNLVQYMVDLGHKHIACLYSPQEYNVSIDRLEGYKKCLIDNNLPLREEYMINCGFTMAEAYQNSQQLFQANPLPTAIFATDDLKLLSLYKTLDERGISTPSDILIGGYSNTDITSFLFPSIIQIENPTHELGKVATTQLFNAITNTDEIERTVIIPTTRSVEGSKYKSHTFSNKKINSKISK